MAGAKESVFILAPLNFKEGKQVAEDKPPTVSETVEKYDPLVFCRTCASMDPCLVPIFKEEGLEYSLNKKIEKYLPIQVLEEDDLPHHLCYHCASTLIAWDSLITGCFEAEKKLTLLKNSSTEKQNEAVVDVESLINESIDSDDEPLSIKKTLGKLNKIEEKRDILQEKNDQSLEPIEIQSERLMEEPDLTFSTYHRQFTIRRPFMFQILGLRIDNPFCCDSCKTVANIKLAFTKVKPPTVPEGKRQNHSKSLGRPVCQNCSKSFSNRLSLKYHMKIHSGEKTCHLCGKVYRHQFGLLRHLKFVHEGVRNHECKDCGKRYRFQGEMEDHRNIHNVKEKILCEECGREFLTRVSYHSHKKAHIMGRKTKVAFECEECHKTFTTKKSKNQHLLIHTGEKPVACKICGKRFRTMKNCTQHEKIHSNVKPYGCHLCGKAFARKDHLKVHIRRHTGERPFVCEDCGKQYGSYGEMEDHRNIHNVQNKIVCEECGLEFLTKISFNSHKKIHRRKRNRENMAFECEECHKKFTSKTSKNHHLLIHRGEKPLSCTTCGKRFRTKKNYSLHAKVHAALKPYRCDLCGKAFGRKDHLRIHIRCHTGEKPYECDHCGRGFAQLNDMKKHRKTHNKNKRDRV